MSRKKESSMLNDKFIAISSVVSLVIVIGIILLFGFTEINIETGQVIILTGVVVNSLVTIIGWRQTYLIQRKERLEKFQFERFISKITDIEQHVDDLSHVISIVLSLGLYLRSTFPKQFLKAIEAQINQDVTANQLSAEFVQATNALFPDMGRVSDLVHSLGNKQINELFSEITTTISEITLNIKEYSGDTIVERVERLQTARRELRDVIENEIIRYVNN